MQDVLKSTGILCSLRRRLFDVCAVCALQTEQSRTCTHDRSFFHLLESWIPDFEASRALEISFGVPSHLRVIYTAVPKHDGDLMKGFGCEVFRTGSGTNVPGEGENAECAVRAQQRRVLCCALDFHSEDGLRFLHISGTSGNQS